MPVTADGSQAIQQTVNTSQGHIANPSLYFDLPSLAAKLAKCNVKAIALQFPDPLLHTSLHVVSSLRSALAPNPPDLFILADTSYASCCVDLVAASHVPDCDTLVHFGPVCSAERLKLPRHGISRVFYAYGREDDCDVPTAAAEIFRLSQEESVNNGSLHLVLHACYEWILSELLQTLESVYNVPKARFTVHLHHESDCHIPKDSLSNNNSLSNGKDYKDSLENGKDSSENDENSSENNENSSENDKDSSARMARISIPEDSCIIYIGPPESYSLVELLMTQSTSSIFSFDPETNSMRKESSLVNSLLMKRYLAIHKARDASIIGLVVGTLGIESYLSVVTRLEDLARAAGKTTYVISVGKPNPAKLANFGEIDVFCMLACPESTIGLMQPEESGQYYRPIITPFELQTALSTTSDTDLAWIPGGSGEAGRYVSDLTEMAERLDAARAPRSVPAKPHFSMSTGRLEGAAAVGISLEEDAGTGEGTTTVAVKGPSQLAVARSGADYLSQRSFRGLEMGLADAAASIVEPGRGLGIARGYEGEGKGLR